MSKILAEAEAIVKNAQQRRQARSKEAAFQLAWACLHLAGALMNFGSAVYHLRRIRKESDKLSLS